MTDQEVKMPEFDVMCLYVDPKLDPPKEAADAANACVLAFIEGKRKCVWVTFAGFDEDPREVWEIEECKHWARTFVTTLMTAGIKDGRKYLSTLGDDRVKEGPGLGLPNLLGLGWGHAVKDNTTGNYHVMIREEDEKVLKEFYDDHS